MRCSSVSLTTLQEESKGGSRNGPCLFGVKLLTCVTQVERDERLAGALRTVCPDRIDQVFFDRHKIMASTSQGFGHPLPLVCQKEKNQDR